MALDSHFAPAYAALANAFLEQDEPKEAEVAFKAVADCAPSHSPLQMEYGQFEIQAGNFAIAQSSFDKLTKEEPDYIPAWLGLAEVALDEVDRRESGLELKLQIEIALLDGPAVAGVQIHARFGRNTR